MRGPGRSGTIPPVSVDPIASSFPRPSIPRASDAVTQALVEGIRSGAASVGARLPKDVELARRFGVSRLVVREAIDRLRRAGVLDVRRGPGGGAFVRSLALPTELLTDRTGLALEEIRALLEARRTVESAGASLALTRAGDEDLDALASLVEQLDASRDDPLAFIELDVQFHLRLAAASGNEYLRRWLGEVFRGLGAARSGYPLGFGDMDTAVAYQRDTLAALRRRERAALETSLDVHLGGLEEHFLGRRLAGALTEDAPLVQRD